MEIRELESVIEALLFTSGDALSIDKIAEILEIDRKTTKLIIGNMILSYQNSNRGIMIREIDNGYQMCTKIEHNKYLKKLYEPRQRQGLSQAAFETLAIIAYNQPVTKAKIEKIRGVNSDNLVNKLMERNLIKEAGYQDSPGKPKLFATTEEFLRSFGFKSISDLPRLEMNELETVYENMPID